MPSESTTTMRLQKFLARAGVGSRRKCEEFIASGRVKVNGHVVREMGTTVNPACDAVEFDGVRCMIPDEKVTLMLNKPAGYLTAMSDAREKTVAELVPIDMYPSIFPIGRLDKDTTGLLLFTTDGELGHALAHPKNHVDKRYDAVVEGRLDEADVARLEQGVDLDGRMTSPAQCEIIAYNPQSDTSHVALTIHEGRKRQVRRMLGSVGHDVIQLERTAFGPLELGELKPSQWRLLTESELAALSR